GSRSVFAQPNQEFQCGGRLDVSEEGKPAAIQNSSDAGDGLTNLLARYTECRFFRSVVGQMFSQRPAGVFFGGMVEVGLLPLDLLNHLVEHLLGNRLVRAERDATDHAIFVLELAIPAAGFPLHLSTGFWIGRDVGTADERSHRKKFLLGRAGA